jgi:hypothetical protein
VAFAEDISLTIHVKSTGRDRFGIKGNIGIREPDPVEDQFQITFAPKMARLLFGLYVSCHVRTARECGTPEFLHRADVTKYGIADAGRLRGKVRLV